jgi:glutaredoxin
MEEKLILYSSSECLRCKIVKNMMDIHGIEYTEILDDKPLMLDKGLEEVPAMEINGELLSTYREVLMWVYDKIGILDEYSEANDDEGN